MILKRSPLYLAAATACTLVQAAPNLTISTTTTSRDFPLSASQPLVVTLTKDNYTLTVTGVEGNCHAPDSQKVKFNTPLALNCDSATRLPINIRFTGDYAFTYDNDSQFISVKRQPKKSTKKVFSRPIPNLECATSPDQSVTISLANTFNDGQTIREVFSGATAVVKNGTVKMMPNKNHGGLMLFEATKPATARHSLNWRNANIYFVMVDRFNNGDTINDNSYGRQKDGEDEIGTFHGGDLKGVIEKLDYIQSLGTDAIWLSPIVEQVHGFVGGGDSGSFPFYAYHGYWTRDFTKIDQNFGDDDDLKKLVKEAHKRGIKIMLDAVVNHPGYATMSDLQFDNLDVLKQTNAGTQKLSDWAPKAGQNWHSFHENIDYNSQNWANWWGADWVRAGLPGYDAPGNNAKTLTLAGLPDFKTESNQFVTPPQWLINNPGTRVVAKQNYRVADYLIEWQADWVKRFGIDAFRVDTVKHVEGDVWLALKEKASNNLAQWQQQNGKPQQPFWMMGEVWAHSAYRTYYADEGFDALINFDMQKKLDNGAACFAAMADTYQSYSDELALHPDYTPVSYMSSHDTELFFGRYKSFDMQKKAANALLLSPGAVQIYYGDEVARGIGPYADDFHQGTRSDMVWELDEDRSQLLQHWQALGQFRQRHPAIGAGTHQEIDQAHGYGFSRTLDDDKVMVYFAGN